MRHCILWLMALTVFIGGCGGSSSPKLPVDTTPPPLTPGNQWVWMAGSQTADAAGVYGTVGMPAATNTPGARASGVTWTDSHGNLWLFGGSTGNAASANGLDYFNDLWRFDGKNWTWMGGSSSPNQPGVYGTKGLAATTDIPGAREGAVSWLDLQGNFWLFGGFGFDSAGTLGYLNDLWRFDGSSWTWVSGSDTVDDPGNFGTPGVPSAASIPGARSQAVSWLDKSGNLWLFSGTVVTAAGTGLINDLWRFDGSNWTFVAGDTPSSYGPKGTPSPSNMPGARYGAVSWSDGSGNMWLFGGTGYDVTYSTAEDLNDLWRFDGSNWTWVSGSQTAGDAGNYGSLGLPAAANTPGARAGATGWTDSGGNLWLFGGRFDDLGDFNDLWRFDGANWTWVSGSNNPDPQGSFGSIGIPAAGNMIGPRSYAMSWADEVGRFWLFGGIRTTPTGMDWLNDLWSY